jgi:predicted oxidoreductase
VLSPIFAGLDRNVLKTGDARPCAKLLFASKRRLIQINGPDARVELSHPPRDFVRLRSARRGGPNTKGGIAANAKRQVLDWDGRPISRLYSAGENSSAFEFVYEGDANLTECIVFGRIAGRNAAEEKAIG